MASPSLWHASKMSGLIAPGIRVGTRYVYEAAEGERLAKNPASRAGSSGSGRLDLNQ
jgi:hypothetical protein